MSGNNKRIKVSEKEGARNVFVVFIFYTRWRIISITACVCGRFLILIKRSVKILITVIAVLTTDITAGDCGVVINPSSVKYSMGIYKKKIILNFFLKNEIANILFLRFHSLISIHFVLPLNICTINKQATLLTLSLTLECRS